DAMTGEEKPRLMKELSETFSDAKAKTLLVVHTCGVFPEMDGKTLDQIAEAWSMSPADALVKLAYGTKTHAACISFGMSEEDVEYMLGQNEFSIGSDGSCLPLDPALNDGKPHPRNFGTFPRFLRLNREKGFCSPEQAIRRITGQSADYIGIKDRGYIRTGLVADITVLDMEKVTDKATYTDPFQKPEGIVHVLMDGQFAVKDGVQTEKRLGKILLRK
ncbi:MAG: amidohydrolase family protein, partial [Firmicutes bacterium]|nr:amidohydrolase family protein [Bacillota bacterium]